MFLPAVHEKIFVVFMVTALLYELLTLIVFKWAHPDLPDKPHVSMNFSKVLTLRLLLSSSSSSSSWRGAISRSIPPL